MGQTAMLHYENALGKQVAVAALIHDSTVVTQNVDDYRSCGVKWVNPFALAGCDRK